MINEQVFLGMPLDFKGKCKVYPPTVKQSCEDQFGTYLAILTQSQEDIEDIFYGDTFEREQKIDNIPTPLEFLFANAFNDKRFEKLAVAAFEFFIHQPVSFLYDQKLIIIGDLTEVVKTIKKVEDLIMINEEEFFDFQNLIRESMGKNPVEPPNPNLHPKIKRMKAKARYRDKIKAKSKNGLNFSSLLSSLCCMGIGITPLNVGEISYAAVSELIARYQEKEKYQLDIDSLLAGADKKKVKPKYWIRNLD